MSEAADKLAAVRALVTASTQRLLGDTIGVDDDAWRAPSRLPRWSRGHVATHLARQADAAAADSSAGPRTGVRQDMYASPQVREDEIEAGCRPHRARAPGRPGHQRGAAGRGLREPRPGRLDRRRPDGAWDAEVELRGGQRVVGPAAPAGPADRGRAAPRRPGRRLRGRPTSTTRPPSGCWSGRPTGCGARDEFPRLELVSDTGFHTTLGSSGDVRRITGSSPALLGWLTGRAAPTSSGAATAWCSPVCDPRRPSTTRERPGMRDEITAFGGAAR